MGLKSSCYRHKEYNKECQYCIKTNSVVINYFYYNGKKIKYKYAFLVDTKTIEEANFVDGLKDCYAKRFSSDRKGSLEWLIINALESFSKEADYYLSDKYDSLEALYHDFINNNPIWKKARTNLVALNILKNNKLICDECKREIKRGENGEMYDLHHKEYVKGELFNPEYVVILHHKCHQIITYRYYHQKKTKNSIKGFNITKITK